MNALIFGAGKTGRGLCALLCQRAAWPAVLVDSDKDLVSLLHHQETLIRVLNDEQECIQLATDVMHSEDSELLNLATTHDLWFTAVFGENLLQLGADLAVLLKQRQQNGDKSLSILTCENKTHAARILKSACLEHADQVTRDYIEKHVRFVEGMVLKTCIYGEDKTQILAQDFYRLPCDADAFNGIHPDSDDLQLLPNFEHQLERKIYTYNAINAVISYLGVQTGHKMLSDAARDPAIHDRALIAASVCNAVLIKKFNFDKDEQAEWSQGALNKFANPAIPDPLERNVAAVRRKLGRQDRLLAPALMAIEYGLDPSPFVEAIVAALFYQEAEGSLIDVYNGNVEACLIEVCNLEKHETLFELIVQRYQGVQSCA